MKIVFMGTPAFAVPTLDLLVKNNYDIAAVITAPDKPAGRGQKIIFSPVKIFALANNLRILQPVKLSDPEFINELKNINADLQIVVAFRMLPQVIWSMPRLGTFNLHGSLLPQYRGAAPINRAVMNGETETGLTTFFLLQQVDTGNIILREKINIGHDESAGELHDRMMITGAELVLKTLKIIESGNINTIPQETLVAGTELKAAPKIFREDCRIDLSKNVSEIYNQVRGLSPFPGAFFELQTHDDTIIPVKVFKCIPESSGVVLTHELQTDHRTFIKLSAADGFINLIELQLPGKKRLNVKEVLSGFKFQQGWKII